ncbi:hypothetical protein [Sphingobium yanoikuyae]|uniref:hypothetical protein n=1 Tax=Sphingobium yanoikuyae TaxID=13690 RepID=UPI0028AFDB91|nr:hypothetical protein [Sphingobium yanoikuyae]
MIDKGVFFVLPKQAVLSASTTAGATSVSNMLHDEKALVWRSTAVTAYILAVQAGLWDTLSLVGTNLRATDTIRVRAANSAEAVTTAPLVDQSFPAFTGMAKATGAMVLFRLPAAVSYTHIRIDISAPGHPSGFVQISNFVVGMAVERDGIDQGAEVSYDNQAANYLRKFLTKPTWKIALSGLTHDEWYGQWEDFITEATDRSGVLFVPIYNGPHMQKQAAFISVVGSPKVTIQTSDSVNFELTVTTIQ